MCFSSHGDLQAGKGLLVRVRIPGQADPESTHQGNQNTARQIEAAHRASLAKGEVGIREQVVSPSVREFSTRFTQAIEVECADKPATVSFYKEKLRRLLQYEPLASCPLDGVDETMVDTYKHQRARQVSRYGRPVTPASVNRELATLRRMLRMAHEWKLLGRVPKIRLLRGEKNRDYVLRHDLEATYLAACPQPLRNVALLILDTGLRVGEAVQLLRTDVHIKPTGSAKFGYLRIRSGKSQNAKRTLSLTARVALMLADQLKSGAGPNVFPGEVPDKPIVGTSLDHQHDAVRSALKLPTDFVIHSLRHTMLTRLGEAGADAFTIMRIAGHSSVTVSQKYVHPSPESLERAFERLESLNAAEREKLTISSQVPTVSTTGLDVNIVDSTGKS